MSIRTWIQGFFHKTPAANIERISTVGGTKRTVSETHSRRPGGTLFHSRVENIKWR